MKTIYTTTSFSGWLLSIVVNALLILGCAKFADAVNWKYLDMSFFLYLVIMLFYFICLKKDEGIPALIRRNIFRERFLMLHVSAFEIVIVLVSLYHIVRVCIEYKDAFFTLM
jgi:hypothetical protein